MRQIGKTGKTKVNGLMVGGFIALLLILALLSYGFYQTMFVGGPDKQEALVTPGSDCSQTPTILLSAVNALDKGSAVTVGTSARVLGVGQTQYQYIGAITSSTKFAVGDKVELLLNASDYLDTIVKEFTLGCDVNRVAAEIYATDDMGVSIKNDAGTSVLTDDAAGGAVNETDMAAGGSKTWEVEFTGKDKKSSGNLIYVVELGSEANISSVTMSDANGNVLTKLSAVPTGLTTSGSNLARYAFKIPAFENAVKKKVYLNVAMNSGKTIAGAVYTTAYSEQAFVDSDGVFKTGVVDASGNTKYEDDFDYDFFIASK